MHLVIAYDVISDRRRNRLAKGLKNYLNRVQKSVFEGEITSEHYDALKKVIAKEINPDEDNVRIYHLCGRCISATEVIGIAVWIPGPEDDEVY